jgi:hypothetical protein
LRGVQSHRARIKSSAAFECSSSFIAAVTTAFLMFVFFWFSRKTVPIEDSTDNSVKALAVGDDGRQGGGQSGLGSRMRVTTRTGAPSLPRVPRPISRHSFLSPCFSSLLLSSSSYYSSSLTFLSSLSCPRFLI